jgi:hypothetical protein
MGFSPNPSEAPPQTDEACAHNYSQYLEVTDVGPHHVRWLGDVHRRSHNYSQYLEVTDVGLVHRSGEKTPTMFGGSVMCIVDRTIIRSIWKLYLEATNGPL